MSDLIEDPPFVAVFWRYHSPYSEEFDSPEGALRFLESMEDYGTGSADHLEFEGRVIVTHEEYRRDSFTAGGITKLASLAWERARAGSAELSGIAP